jgi:hypothetical protein
MVNRPKYWCKRRVRLTSMSTGQVFATRFCAFASLYFSPLILTSRDNAQQNIYLCDADHQPF